MSLDNISQFLSAIDRSGELARISEPVRARLELCEIADRVMKQPGGGKALYFENVILDNGERSKYPAVINLFGSMRRICLALGVDDLDDIGRRITEMLDLKVPEGLIGKLAMLPRLLEIGKFPPRVRSGKPACPSSWATSQPPAKSASACPSGAATPASRMQSRRSASSTSPSGRAAQPGWYGSRRW